MENHPILTTQPLDIPALEKMALEGHAGCLLSFQNLTRGDDGGQGTIDHYEFETYDAPAQKELSKILETARGLWPNARVILQHRTGRIPVGEPSSFIGVSSTNFKESFEVCRYVIEQIDSGVPIWKKIIYRDGHSAWADNRPKPQRPPARV